MANVQNPMQDEISSIPPISLWRIHVYFVVQDLISYINSQQIHSVQMFNI